MHAISSLLLRLRNVFRNEKHKTADFSQRNCLVGIVRNAYQLEMNLKHNFYHVPARFVYELDLPIQYIAVYQSAKTFAGDAGVRYYGSVTGYRLMPRCEITHIPKSSGEPYFCFYVDEWKKLDKPIEPLETASIVMLTNIDILKQSRYMPELYMRSAEELKMFKFLESVCLDRMCGKRYNFNGIKIGATSDVIEVIFKNGEHRRFDRYLYDRKPYSLYRSIMLHSNKTQ